MCHRTISSNQGSQTPACAYVRVQACVTLCMNVQEGILAKKSHPEVIDNLPSLKKDDVDDDVIL